MARVSEASKEKHKQDSKELRWWYRDHGFCPRCHKPNDDGRIYCAECRKRYYEEWKSRYTPEERHELVVKRRERLKAEGKCVDCAIRPARKGRTQCVVCARKQAEQKQVVRIKKKIAKEASK